MGNERKSTQKARFESFLNEKEGTKGHRKGVQYTRLDGDKAPQSGSKALKLVAQFTADEIQFMKGLKEGDEFVVEKIENKWTTPDGKEATSWNLSTVRDISTWVEPTPKKPWTGSKGDYSSKKEWKDNGPASKIGGLYHDAATLLASKSNISELSLEFIASQMAELVRLMVKDSMEIEKEITPKINGATTTTQTTTSGASTSPTSQLNSSSSSQSSEEDDFFGDMGRVVFE